MNIIGISAFYHDAAACLISNGKIIAAAQEERFTRIKHDSSFPINAIKYCINEKKINFENINYVVFYEKPFSKFERLLETYLAFAPKGYKSFSSSMPLWIKDKLFQKNQLIKELKLNISKKIEWENKLLFSDHHLSHAASAFYPSPFKESAILTMDGVGEWATTSFGVGQNNKINIIKEINFPHSLGLLYSAFTFYTGFKVNSGEYKLMGLAPYGEPKYEKQIRDNLIEIKDDGSFKLNMNYFDYHTGLKMTNKNFDKLFSGPPRKSESKISQKEMDIAASIQKVTEDIVILMSRNIAKQTGMKYLCMAGGVALNCVANGKLNSEKIFEKLWIQPAAGDAGGAIGAALAVYYMMMGNQRIDIPKSDSMQGSYLGPQFSNNEVAEKLNSLNANFTEYDEKGLIKISAEKISNGKAIGWMQGRMEFGPRALGNRSIIADSRSPSMQKLLNLKIKYRESFRPFAPSVLIDDLTDWFDLNEASPYMLLVSKVKKDKLLKISNDKEKLFGIDKLNVARSQIPAVTHVDYTARIQTVHKETNPLYYDLIEYVKKLTKCPVIVNTSFNVRGEPIVCNVEDAFRCFMGTELDILVIGNKFLIKENQKKELKDIYKDKYELD